MSVKVFSGSAELEEAQCEGANGVCSSPVA